MADDKIQASTASQPDATVATATAGKFAAFQIPNFRILFAGRVTSNMARQMRVFLRGWMVLELTNSPLLMGVVISSLSWPMLVLPFVGGVMADRIDRKLLLKWTETLLVVLWAATTALVMLGAWDVGPSFLRIRWWHFIITSVLSGVIQSIGRPGHQAMVGSIVDKGRLSSAVALDSIADHWPRVAGPALGTVAIAMIGGTWHNWGPWLFGLTAAGQLFTAITIFLLKWEPGMKVARTHDQSSAWRDFINGIQHIKGEPVLLSLVALGISFMLFAGGASFLLPVFTRDVLGYGPEQGAAMFGILSTLQTVGSSLGALIVVLAANFRNRGMLLFFIAVLHGACLIAFSQSTVLLLSAALILGTSFTGVFFSTTRRMFMQLAAPDHLRGRVMSMEVFQQGLSPIGVIIWGSIAELMQARQGLAEGTQTTWLLGGLMYTAIAVLFFAFVPALRRLR